MSDRVRHLKAEFTNTQIKLVNDALTFYRLMHSMIGNPTPMDNGAVLAAILGQWLEMTTEELKVAKKEWDGDPIDVEEGEEATY